MRTHEPTRVEAGKARILRATISREGRRWFVRGTCEVERETKMPPFPDAVVGADVGRRPLAVLSTGERVPKPRPLRKAVRTLARLHRELARRAQGSRNREETRRRLARLHARVAHIRRDAVHKLTIRPAPTYGTIVVETLNVAGMLRHGRLARAVADALLAEIRRQPAYETLRCGPRPVEASRSFPSSRTSSRCGTVKGHLPSWERTFRCDACGLALDRHEDPARTLAASWPPSPGVARDVNRGRDGRASDRRVVPEEAGSRRRRGA